MNADKDLTRSPIVARCPIPRLGMSLKAARCRLGQNVQQLQLQFQLERVAAAAAAAAEVIDGCAALRCAATDRKLN